MDNTSNSSYKCVTWDEVKNEWNQNGLVVEKTKFCPNYISCFTTHLSDFTVVYDETPPSDNVVFDDIALRTNAAWWLCFVWFLTTVGLTLAIYSKRKDEPEIPLQQA